MIAKMRREKKARPVTVKQEASCELWPMLDQSVHIKSDRTDAAIEWARALVQQWESEMKRQTGMK